MMLESMRSAVQKGRKPSIGISIDSSSAWSSAFFSSSPPEEALTNISESVS
jgi:hypothetical protein